ncbi:hypothetical protein PTSG_06043 [Salpingoeca rosetta]|uniref:TRPM SLOG domain-containing protein n=1 Tax=Salpingoeca rosetta (strain ATCC 50818 / BSB-021) TaxID=946362 RepID=F2UDI3_SALR5|nr:uncharacterized protein PTSG_06043 [Salpingoeca rosetta]EGD74678.1 hypothetical protein PTSG_06043 [Salpingoeca rosetta]|eukprot:XP_004992935.1 hypothetical protein PTSG_06043 [Salpingoeca rosetta]
MSDWQDEEQVSSMPHDDDQEYSDLYSAWIERSFAIHVPPPNTEKPKISMCKRAPTTCYGQVTFDQVPLSNGVPRSGRPFIRLSTTTKPALVTQLLSEQWGLRLPRMIISVTGGATTFELPPRLDKMIRQGLCKAATSSNAWIVTGGTNTGVMKYVGQAIKDVQSQVTSPLIGIVPWSIVNNKDALCELETGDPTRGAVVSYGDPDRFTGRAFCSLDRNHTHFLLVDDGTLDEFGGEIKLRADVEQNVGSRISGGQFGIDFPVSNVVIAIQGGPGTVRTCLEAVRDGIPIVVVNGSGKAADAIAYAFNLLHHSHSDKYSQAGLTTLVREQLSRTQQDDEVAGLVKQVLECASNKEQVFVYEVDFYGRHDVPLDVAILDAILQWESYRIEHGELAWLLAEDVPQEHRKKERSFRAELRKARLLELALTWDRIDVARQETAKYRVLKDFDDKIASDPITQAKARMLKWALVNNRQAFVQIFLETMDTQDVTAFLRTPTTSGLTLPSLRKISHSRSKTRAKGRARQMIKWSNLKHRFSVPLPPTLNTDPLPAHCHSLLADIAATKMYCDLKELFQSRLTITQREMRQYDFNIDFDHDDVADIRKREELIIEANKRFTMANGANAWHMLSYFDVFFVRFLFAQGFMVSRIPVSSSGPPPRHAEAIEGLTRAIHLIWVHRMLDDGWSYGKALDEEMQESPLICAYDNQNDGSAFLNEDIKHDMRAHAARFMETLYSSMRIVIWQPNTLESLFIHPTLTRTPRHNAKYTHLVSLFPGGSFWESQIRHVLAEAVHSDAEYVYLFELDPFFLLAVWAAVTNFPRLTKYFWHLSPQSAIPNGLVLTLVVKAALEHDEKLPPESIVVFEGLANDIMEECVDILNHIDQRNSKLAERILRSRPVNGGMVQTTTLAYRIGYEAFVATDAFLRVLNYLWYDNVDPTNGLIKIFIAALFPFYLVIPGEQLKESHGHAHLGFWETLKRTLPVRIDTSVAIDSNSDGVIDEADDVYEELIRDSSVANLNMFDRGPQRSLRGVKALRRSMSEVIVRQDSPLNVLWRRLYYFYTSPAVGFLLETVSYIVLLLLFSYSALLPTTSWRHGFLKDQGPVPAITFIWMCILMVEEVRQATHQGLRMWWGQLWNRWDAIIYLTYLIAVGLRLSPREDDLGRSRYVYSGVAIMLWTRLARHYAVNQDLGPKLIMVQLMVKDIVVFLGLMVLVFAGYSVALYSVLEENRDWERHTFTEMVFIPYFQIYGELFLEEMRDKTTCANMEFTDCGGDPGWFAAPLLAAYIMIANILLVNLLIAMMSSTYEAVQSRALELWAYQNLDALFEVKETWFLPAPFNIAHNVYLGFVWVLGLLRSTCQPNKVAPDEEGTANLKQFFLMKRAGKAIEDDADDLTEAFWRESLNEDEHARVMDAIKKLEGEVQLVQRLVLNDKAPHATESNI